jgi:acetolactate decarboxylase
MTSKFAYVGFVLGASALAGSRPRPAVVYQTSVIAAFQEGVYDGTESLAELQRHGDFGLGAFAGIDGELVLLDGKAWRVSADGHVRAAAPGDAVSFVVATFFKDARRIPLHSISDLAALQAALDGAGPSKNSVWAVRVKGRFRYAKTRAIALQKPPYKCLAEVAKTQSVFELRERAGTLVGFRYPAYAAGVNVPGYHFHLLTTERDAGGHVLELQGIEGEAEVVALERMEIALPHDGAFGRADLSRASGEELRKVEGGR